MQKIVIQTLIDAAIDKVWNLYTDPNHIINWNNASEDWHTPHAVNDLKVGGSFFARMEAKDGSAGFDFGGIYDQVVMNKLIEYTMSDGRHVRVDFVEEGSGTRVTVTFDAEETNSIAMQQSGWQSILDNFKKYVQGL